MSSYNENVLIKEYMAKMPDTLTTKKEIDEYYKAGWKDIKEKIKEEKKKEGPTKRPKKVNVNEVDEDGNNDKEAKPNKVEKPPTARKKFFDEMRPKIKENFPDLNPQKTAKKLAQLWETHMNDMYGYR